MERATNPLPSMDAAFLLQQRSTDEAVTVDAFSRRLLTAMYSFREGNFAVRLPPDLTGVEGKIADAFNDIVTLADDLPTSRLRLLVVDDNRDSVDSLSTLLRMMGNDVHMAFDGVEAVNAAHSLRPDVILLDVGLPLQSGYEAARLIRSESWGRNMVLIALTGWGQEQDRKRSREAGFDHHLVKPVDPQALMKLVSELAYGSRTVAPHVEPSSAQL